MPEASTDVVRQIWTDPDFHTLDLEDRRQIMSKAAPDFADLTPEDQDKVFQSYAGKFGPKPAVPAARPNRSIDQQAAHAMAQTGLEPPAMPGKPPMVPREISRTGYLAGSLTAPSAPNEPPTGHPAKRRGFQWPGSFEPTPEEAQKFKQAAQTELAPAAPLVDAGNIPIPFSGPELTGGMLGKSPNQLRKEDPKSLYAGALAGGAKVVSGLTSPGNLALIGGMALAPPAVAALANLGLSAEMGVSAVESVPEAARAYKEGRYGDFAELATQGLASAGMAGAGVRHLVKGQAETPQSPASTQAAVPEAPYPGLSREALRRVFGLPPEALRQLYSVETDPNKLAAIVSEAHRRGIDLPARPAPTTPAERSAAALNEAPDYANLFEQADARDAAIRKGRETIARKEAAAGAPPVPQTGIPEPVARVQDARDRIARQVTGKQFSELNNPDRLAIDDLIQQGYTGAGDIAAPPPPPPPAIKAAHADLLGGESAAIQDILKSASVGNVDAPTVARALASSGAGSAVLEAASHPEVAAKLQGFPTLREAVSLLAEHPEASVGADAGHPVHKQAAYDSLFDTLGIKPPKPPKANEVPETTPQSTEGAPPEPAPSPVQETPAPSSSPLEPAAPELTPGQPERPTVTAAVASAPEEAPKHEYSSTQIDLPGDIAADLQKMGARIPDEHLTGDGRENESHVTVKYGLHGADPEEVRRVVENEPPIRVKLGKTSLFKNDDADVVKVDVDSSDLSRINKKIADALPHTDTHPTYEPHATVAYVKPGEGGRYDGLSDVEGREAVIDRITFSGKNGEKVDIPLLGSAEPPPVGPPTGHPAKRRGMSQRGSLFPQPEPPKTPAEIYADEMTAKQEAARKGAEPSLGDRLRSLYGEAKAKLVDANAPIEDTLDKSQKAAGYQIRPQHHISDKIDRVYRADKIAGQFLEENGLLDIAKNVDNDKYFDQYLIARQAQHVRERGIETGRDAEKDQLLLDQFKDRPAIPGVPTERPPVTYEQAAKQVTGYAHNLLDYITDAGLISDNLRDVLKERYPEYVPLQRVFEAIEKEESRRYKDGPGTASLSSQSIIKSLEGSERQIESPLGSLLDMTRAAFRQGEKNKAAATLAGYRELPVFDKLITEVKPGEAPGKNTFSYLDAGKKRTFETTPEIAAAAKALDSQQLGILGQMFALPVRVAKMGITGINLPFAAANVVRDQGTAWVTSPYWKETSIANPKNFLRALMGAIKHDDLYQQMVREGAGGTSFDIARNPGRVSVEEVRSHRGVASRIAYVAKNPSELLRGVEDIIGRSEELTRLQQFSGTYQALLKRGRTPEDASVLAAMAARDNTANFSRRGSWGKPLNTLFLYLNPAIQGGRTHIHAFQRNPVGATARLASGVLFPAAALTMWNMADPERRKVYDDIEEYEKQNNLIFVPDGATKDDKNRWNVIKVPLPQGLNTLTDMVRKPLEGAWGINPTSAMDAARALLGPVSPVDLERNKIASEFVPQAVKPTAEVLSNYDFFRDVPIVSDKTQKLSPEKQAYPWTSGFSKQVGQILGVSPIKVDHFVKATFGGVGAQATGMENPIEASAARFTKARAGAVERQEFQKVRAAETKAADEKFDREERVKALDQQLKQMTPDEARSHIQDLVQQGQFNEDDWKALKKLRGIQERPKSTRSMAELRSQPPTAKIEYLAGKLSDIPDPQAKAQFLQNMREQGILTRAVWSKLKDRIQQ